MAGLLPGATSGIGKQQGCSAAASHSFLGQAAAGDKALYSNQGESRHCHCAPPGSPAGPGAPGQQCAGAGACPVAGFCLAAPTRASRLCEPLGCAHLSLTVSNSHSTACLPLLSACLHADTLMVQIMSCCTVAVGKLSKIDERCGPFDIA